MQQPPYSGYPPQPHGGPPPPRRPLPARRGCGRNAWVIAAAALLLPVFLCGLGFVAYLVFPPQQLDVLVLGVDARQGEGYVARTDSVILVGVQPSRLRVSMLSIPRDLFLDVPGYGLQRINTVNVLGEQEATGQGPVLLASAFQNSFGIEPERYIRLNFQGFVDLIDAVGGVTIDVERTIVDYAYPTADGGTMTVQFDPGVQHMDGEQALIYARTRHSDDDYQRANRQQQVISALSARLINPLTWPAAISVLSRSMDTNLTVFDMATVAPVVLLNAGRFDRLVIDRDYIAGAGEGVAVPDYAALAPWVNERFD